MNISRSWRKGAILLQTLIVSMLLAYISVMIMSWVLQRYSLATRVYRKNVATTHTTGYAMMKFAKWNTGTPANDSTTMDAKTVSIVVSGTQMQISTEQD